MSRNNRDTQTKKRGIIFVHIQIPTLINGIFSHHMDSDN
jgi:hypothetical protein